MTHLDELSFRRYEVKPEMSVRTWPPQLAVTTLEDTVSQNGNINRSTRNQLNGPFLKSYYYFVM